MLKSVLNAARAVGARVITTFIKLKKRFDALSLIRKILVVLILIALVGGIFLLIGKKAPEPEVDQRPAVSVRSVKELSGGDIGATLIGTVRSRSEAEIRSEASGTVTRVDASLGARVGAGAVIAELENASERAAVLQAEGAYDAALAARAAVSPVDAASSARAAYQSAFATLDTAIETYIDAFFGGQTNQGPSVLLSRTKVDRVTLSDARSALDKKMDAWRTVLPEAPTRDPALLLSEADAVVTDAQALLELLAESANATDSGASAGQLSALASGRASVNGVAASLAATRATYRSTSTGSTASVDAAVKSARGTLEAARANLARTILRAPIGGTLNFFPLRVGDYVTALEHVATVAENGALEVIAFVSEDQRVVIREGDAVVIDGDAAGVVTAIAPALDPTTKQIEVRVAVETTSRGTLINGQSVRVVFPGIAPEDAPEAPLLLPLTAVKLTPGSRVVFTVGEDGRLIALPVEIGDVRGGKLEIRSGLTGDEEIVEDARGLSEGEEVRFATGA